MITRNLNMTYFDLNGDGKVSDEEIARKERQVELENKDLKEDQQRSMAWVAIFAMVTVTVFLFLPIMSDERVAALADLIGLFYIAMAGIVAAFFGSSAYMNVNR
jgi:Trk-type K+ transport system membrane component